MLFPVRTSAWLGTAAMALFLLLATGCAKEEVMAPSAPQGLVKKAVKPGNPGGNGNSTVGSGNSGTGNSITDDGDDMGDNERSTKPK
jgi:hypothetical protein